MIIHEPLLNFLKHISSATSTPPDYFEKNLGALEAAQFEVHHGDFNLSADDKTIIAIAALKKKNFALFKKAIQSGGLTCNPCLNTNLSFLQQHYTKDCFSSAAKIEAFLSCGGRLSQRYSTQRKIKSSEGFSHYAFNAPGENFELVECIKDKVNSIDPDVLIDAFENEWITAKVPSHVSDLFFSNIFAELLYVDILNSGELKIAMNAERLERIRQLQPLPASTVAELFKSSQKAMACFFKNKIEDLSFFSELLPVLNLEHQKQKENQHERPAFKTGRDDETFSLSLEQEECLLFVLNHFWGNHQQPFPPLSSWETVCDPKFIKEFSHTYDFSSLSEVLIASCLLQHEEAKNMESLSPFVTSQLFFSHGYYNLNALHYLKLFQCPEEPMPQFFHRVLTHPLNTPEGVAGFLSTLNQSPVSDQAVLNRLSFDSALFEQYQTECIKVCLASNDKTITMGIQHGLSTTNDPNHLFSVLHHQRIQQNVQPASHPNAPSLFSRF